MSQLSPDTAGRPDPVVKLPDVSKDDATQLNSTTSAEAAPAPVQNRRALLADLALRSNSVSSNAVTAVVASDRISRQLRDETRPFERRKLFAAVRWEHVKILLIQDADSWGRSHDEAVGIADAAVADLREEVGLLGLDPEASLFGRLVRLARDRAAPPRESHDASGELGARVARIPRNGPSGGA